MVAKFNYKVVNKKNEVLCLTAEFNSAVSYAKRTGGKIKPILRIVR